MFRTLVDDAKVAASHQDIFKMGEELGKAACLQLRAVCFIGDKMLWLRSTAIVIKDFSLHLQSRSPNLRGIVQESVMSSSKAPHDR